MALIAEVAELAEHFQWLTEDQSSNLAPEKVAAAELEIARYPNIFGSGWRINCELMSWPLLRKSSR
jgi:hypothetical protein